jgi:hypothetical protein
MANDVQKCDALTITATSRDIQAMTLNPRWRDRDSHGPLVRRPTGSTNTDLHHQATTSSVEVPLYLACVILSSDVTHLDRAPIYLC